MLFRSISNISGVDKVASGVVFIDGKADKAQYRRYRIRTVEGADDFRSMYETLTRRLIRYKNGDAGFEELPDLIVIDGGLEQVEFASRAADDVGVRVPMVGLAKKDEELYLRGNPEPVKLKRDDYALRLLQRVRDEAHRFAVLYHRSLRSKRYESELKSVDGVGSATVKKVLKAFNTRAVATATADEIAEKAGITKAAARNIYLYYHPGEDVAPRLKYKLIATDLDGTLLNDELTVSERNLLAIEKFRAAGGIFTIATGRMPSSVKRYAEMLGLDAHPVKMICNIGGIIVDSATMETERLASVSPQSASALLRYALPRVEFGLMYYASGAIASEMSEAVEIYFSAIGLTPQSVDDLPKRAEAFDEPIVKIVLITDEREVRGLTESLAAAFDDMQFIQSTAPLLQRLRAVRPELNPALIECVARGADKGTDRKSVV